MNRTCLGLVLLTLFVAAPTEAQRRPTPRVLELDLHHAHPGLPPPLVMYVGAPDACPGATLVRLCGSAVPAGGTGTCPELSSALATLGTDGLGSCRAEPDLVPVAIALQSGTVRDGLAASRRLFELVEQLPRYRALAMVARMTTSQQLATSSAAPHATMARLMALPRLAPGMRTAAIEVFAHILVERDGNEDGVDDLADETAISATRLPNMPGASEMAWRTLELLMYAAEYQDVQRALDTFQARWPDARKRERDDMRAQALRLNLEFNQMLIHLRASALRCDDPACRTHFRETLRSFLVERMRTCREGPVERPLARRCMRDALEAEGLLSPDARSQDASQGTATVRADVASTLSWAAGELNAPSANLPPAMQTPRRAPAANIWGGDVDRRSLWRLIARRSIERLRRCGPRRGGAVNVQLRVGADGAVTLGEASRARRCLQRALRDLRGPPAEGGVGLVDGTFVFAPR